MIFYPAINIVHLHVLYNKPSVPYYVFVAPPPPKWEILKINTKPRCLCGTYAAKQEAGFYAVFCHLAHEGAGK